MRWSIAWLAAAGLCLCSLLPASAQSPGFHPTHPFGGNSSYYQYRRDYGNPYYGDAIRSGPGYQPVSGGGYYPYYAPVYGIGSWGFRPGGFYGMGYSSFWYAPIQPAVFGGIGYGLNNFGYVPGGYTAPFIAPTTFNAPVQQGVAGNPVLEEAWRENQLRWGDPLPERDPADLPNLKPIVPSTAEGRRRSLQAQLQGDDRLRRQEWALASERYRQAIDSADDVATNHIRYGVALVAQKRFDTAVKAFRRAAFVDRQIASAAPRLDDLFGDDQPLIKLALISKATEWAQEDIRDPQRLFVLGVVMRLNEDERADEVLESGYRLAGKGDHFLAYLGSSAVARAPSDKSAPQPGGNHPLPAPPEPAPPPENGAELELPPAPAPAEPQPAARETELKIPEPPGVGQLPRSLPE